MSRDLTIYGVEAEAEALKSDEQIDAFFRVVEGLDYESYASQGLIELISYRSKSIGLAISQVITDLIENRYGVIGSVVRVDGGGANWMLLSQSELITILDWLALMSRAMGESTGQSDFDSADSSELLALARRVSQKIDFSGDEFEWFGGEYGLFREWQRQIVDSGFAYYLWEDSY